MVESRAARLQMKGYAKDALQGFHCNKGLQRQKTITYRCHDSSSPYTCSQPSDRPGYSTTAINGNPSTCLPMRICHLQKKQSNTGQRPLLQ
ncbi:hypothetical protein WJX77_006678 [Trebouxia sp. C0004]